MNSGHLKPLKHFTHLCSVIDTYWSRAGGPLGLCVPPRVCTEHAQASSCPCATRSIVTSLSTDIDKCNKCPPGDRSAQGGAPGSQADTCPFTSGTDSPWGPGTSPPPQRRTTPGSQLGTRSDFYRYSIVSDICHPTLKGRVANDPTHGESFILWVGRRGRPRRPRGRRAPRRDGGRPGTVTRPPGRA